MKRFKLIKFTFLLTLFFDLHAYGSQNKIISIEVLSQTVKMCNHDVEKLWKKRHHISQKNKRDFQISLANASEDCQQLQKIYTQLCQASQIKNRYDYNLEKAESKSFQSN